MISQPTLQDVLAYFGSVRTFYPGGIPERLIKSCEVGMSLLFIVRDIKEMDKVDGGWALLQGAVTKGLNIPWESVTVIDLVNQQEWRKDITRLLKFRPKAVVLLGGAYIEELIGVSDIGNVRGIWHDYEGVPVMPTHGVSEVLGSTQVKREFWEDLKKVRERLGSA